MSRSRLLCLTALAMAAFAGNSLLCRVALRGSALDAAHFTSLRLASGAITLAVLAQSRRGARQGVGNWLSALALFAYAAGFSLAYRSLSAGTGALLLFGAVQATMIGQGVRRGERLSGRQCVGLLLALGGLIALLLPGLTAPPLVGSLWMLGAGFAWGVYSLRGRGAGDPVRVTAGNFLRATPLALLWSLWNGAGSAWDGLGVGYAIASGALASGVGYAIWYSALPSLRATSAATVQLSVPVLAALGGVVFLGEGLTQRLMLASVTILGGIALALVKDFPPRGAPSAPLPRG